MPTMVRTTLRTTDAIPANFIQNQICIDHPDGDGPNVTATVTAVKAFYDSIRSAVLPSVIAQNGHITKFYALPGIEPNYPYDEVTWNMNSAPSGAELPREVAIAVSFQGSRAAGFPQARRRGRMFIGPLLASVNVGGRPSSAAKTALITASEVLYDNLNVSLEEGWGIWSVVDQTATRVVDGWVDDAFDVQRRRGVEVTSRETWAAVE